MLRNMGEKIIELINNREALKRLGIAAKQKVLAHYDISVAAKHILDRINSL